MTLEMGFHFATPEDLGGPRCGNEVHAHILDRKATYDTSILT